jgi:glycosyltransferase involved in cell wall biosynthesis
VASRPDIVVSHPGNPRVYDMVAALVREGFAVRFATGYYFDPSGPETRLPAHLQRELRRRSHPGVDPAIVSRSFVGEAIARGLGKFAPAWRDAASNAWFDRRAARLIRRWRPRCVLAAETCALSAFRAAEQVGAKRILDQVIGFEGEGARLIREELALHPELAGTSGMPGTATIARCRAEAIAADLVLVPSAYVQETMRAVGVEERRFRLLPYGIDSTRFTPAPRAAGGRPFRVLFVGQIGVRKGVHYLLEALRVAALPDSELVLAGSVIGSAAWLEPFRNTFRYIAHVPHSEVHTLFRDADIYVFPSLHEGLSLSVLEAMASGLPVVTTVNSGAPVTDGVEGFLVPIRDAAALADRIRRLHADPALRARMGAAARATAERYDLKRYEAGLARAVRDLLGETAT